MFFSIIQEFSSVFQSIALYSIKPLKGTSWHFSTASANSHQLHQVNALLVLQANRHLTHCEEHSRLLPTHLNFHQRRISGPYSDLHLVLPEPEKGLQRLEIHYTARPQQIEGRKSKVRPSNLKLDWSFKFESKVFRVTLDSPIFVSEVFRVTLDSPMIVSKVSRVTLDSQTFVQKFYE